MKEIFTDTSFYYFYSTIPQVLAGGIALVGAFLIFLFAQLNKKMLIILEDAWDHVEKNSDYEKIWNLVIKKHTNLIEKTEYIEKKDYNLIFERIHEYSKGKDPIFNRYYHQFKIEFNLKSDVTTKGIRAVVLSGILMAICIFILPFVQCLSKCLPFGIFFTVSIIGFSCYAIYLIAYVVVSTIRKL